MEFSNTYEDNAYASAYAKLEFPGTYYLAFRDLPDIFSKHVQGKQALDFGCGAGRSTRFLRKLGFDAIGVDIAEEMTGMAHSIDASGDYRVVEDGNLSQFAPSTFDLVLSAFTLDNVPTLAKKSTILSELERVLRPDGRIVSLVSSPEIYLNEWASFSTKDFPENREAKSGDRVKIIVTALEDKRPTVDIVCSEEDYRSLFIEAGLEVAEIYRPLGKEGEPYEWISETALAPWTIYVLKKA